MTRTGLIKAIDTYAAALFPRLTFACSMFPKYTCIAGQLQTHRGCSTAVLCLIGELHLEFTHGEHWRSLLSLFAHILTLTYQHMDNISYVHTLTYCICRNFHQEKIFANFAICSHWRNFYHANFMSRVNDYIEDMATFTALAKIYSTKYFCNTKVYGVGEIFVKWKFSRIWYIHTYIHKYTNFI